MPDTDNSTTDKIPPGFTLRHTLRGHSELDWSHRVVVRWEVPRFTIRRSVDPPLGCTNRTTSSHFLGHTDCVTSVAWSPDGKTLASGAEDNTIRYWDVHTGHLLQTLKGHSDWVWSVAWSQDGKMLASGGSDRTIRLWEVQTGRSLGTLEGHSGNVFSVAWSSDGKMLASGSVDRTVRL